MNEKKANKYFEELNKIRLAWVDYSNKRDELAELNLKMMSADDYRDWSKANPVPKCPLSNGQYKAFALWYWDEDEREELNVDEVIWEDEIHDFVETLRKAGYKSFTVTDASTALMRNMHAYAAEGCTLAGLCEVEGASRGGDTKKGVRFLL